MDLLDRLHRRLVAATAESSDSDSHRTTIADLYQRLIPYRVIRGEIGVMELAEYEHALLRLLSGERRYVELADPAAVVEIQRELASLSPILGIYRDFANVAVRVVATGGSAGATASIADPRVSAQASPNHPATPPAPATPGAPLPVPAPVHRSKAAAASSGGPPANTSGATVSPMATTPAARACQGCERRLPAKAEANFCPFCGQAQAAVPCRSCGAILEPTWRFCVRCGIDRSATPAS